MPGLQYSACYLKITASPIGQKVEVFCAKAKSYYFFTLLHLSRPLIYSYGEIYILQLEW